MSAELSLLSAALCGGLTCGVGFREQVADRPDGDVVEIKRIAVSRLQRFNRRYVPLRDYEEKPIGRKGVVHLALAAAALGTSAAREASFAM
jgi:hypothetical protein